MTDRIEQPHPAGTPTGTYDIFYYTVKRDGRVVRQAGFDADVRRGSVDRVDVREDEIAVATCKSSPGGLTVFGSRRVQEAWNAA